MSDQASGKHKEVESRDSLKKSRLGSLRVVNVKGHLLSFETYYTFLYFDTSLQVCIYTGSSRCY